MTIQRGEVYFINLNPVQGREQAGQHPVVVLSIDTINRLPLVLTVIVGTKRENVPRDYPTNASVLPADSGVQMETVVLCFQLRLLEPRHFPGTPAGRVSGCVLKKIEQAGCYCLGL